MLLNASSLSIPVNTERYRGRSQNKTSDIMMMMVIVGTLAASAPHPSITLQAEVLSYVDFCLSHQSAVTGATYVKILTSYGVLCPMIKVIALVSRMYLGGTVCFPPPSPIKVKNELISDFVLQIIGY